MDTKSLPDVVTMEEREEALGAGVGILTETSKAVQQSYREQLMQAMINILALELAGLSKGDTRKAQGRIRRIDLERAYADLRLNRTEVLEAKLAALASVKDPHLVRRAMRAPNVRLAWDVNGNVTVSRIDTSVETPVGKFVTEEEFERMDAR